MRWGQTVENREREEETAWLVIVSYICAVCHCVSFSFDFPLDGVQISRQRPVQSGVLSNYKHFCLQNALLMSVKRVQRASLIRSHAAFTSTHLPTHSPTHSFTQSVTQSVTLSVCFLFANRTHQQQQHFRPTLSLSLSLALEYLSLAITQIVLHIFRIHNSGLFFCSYSAIMPSSW